MDGATGGIRSRADGLSASMTAGSDEGDADSLLRQNLVLRSRLEEEAASYRRRIDTYRQAQQNQAALVSRLQAKVLQYKQRCAQLEAQMGADELDASKRSPGESPALLQAQRHLQEAREERIQDLETAMQRLEEERKRNDKLAQLNSLLREQLEESHASNEALTADIQKLSTDWEQMREEMMAKEDEWRDEEQAFNDYYSNEHSRLLGLWRDVVSVKRLFSEMQSCNERDLLKLRSELANVGREVGSACSRIADSTRYAAAGLPDAKQRSQYERDAAELRQQIQSLAAKNDGLRQDISSKEDRIQ